MTGTEGFTNTGERWLPIPGHEERYEVSDQGRVRSLPRQVVRKNGSRVFSKGKVLAQTHPDGYALVNLITEEGSKRFKVHRLVALAFIPNPENLPFVLHGDGTRDNNGVENLRWGTREQNIQDSRNHGAYRLPYSKRTHCLNGHEFNEENARFVGTRRQCRTCTREWFRRQKAEKMSLLNWTDYGRVQGAERRAHLKLWIDDIRTLPGGYTGWDDWALTSTHAINLLRARKEQGVTYEEVSFDHDLGGDDTSRRVMTWMIENDCWPRHIHVHTANPVGRDWLVGTARRYAPDGVTISF